jgi:hypothetical protein
MQHSVATPGATIPRVEENGNEMSRVQTAAERYRQAQTEIHAAREELHAAIRAALAAGLPIGQVARESGYDREHVRRIRDGD